MVVDERRQQRGGGEAGPSLAEAAAEVQGVARGFDRGVVELVAAQAGAGRADGLATVWWPSR